MCSALWRERLCADEYIGTLVNAYLGRGGRAVGVKAGRAYVDVGTLGGYRSAITLLSGGNGAPGLDGPEPRGAFGPGAGLGQTSGEARGE